MGFARKRMQDRGATADFRLLSPGEPVTLGPFRVNPIRVAHSVLDSLALAIETPAGVVMASGDFKISAETGIAAGVRYGAGYPITPWSSVMEVLRRELPKYGGIFVQAEDELASVSIALGFSYSGYLAVTGSAGPGISLKTEAIGWASMAEMPLIIAAPTIVGPTPKRCANRCEITAPSSAKAAAARKAAELGSAGTAISRPTSSASPLTDTARTP